MRGENSQIFLTKLGIISNGIKTFDVSIMKSSIPNKVIVLASEFLKIVEMNIPIPSYVNIPSVKNTTILTILSSKSRLVIYFPAINNVAASIRPMNI